MPINIDGSKGIRQNTTEVTKIPVGTTAQRPANPEAGMLRFNTDEGVIEGYDLAADEWRNINKITGVFASGGTVTDIEQDGELFRVHTFTSSGTFDVTRGGDVDVLVVAGGGGGCETAARGGAGGAGGLIFEGGKTIPAGSSETVIVGDGGEPVIAFEGEDGEDSVFLGLTAIGGGGGGAYNTSTPGRDGGSGGGGGAYSSVSPGGIGLQPSSDSGGFGNNGGSGQSGNSNGSGGGGGADGLGGNGSSGVGGVGGAGMMINISGQEVFYASGGNGRFNGTIVAGGGGVGDGEPNTGGGGQGGRVGGVATGGGSGIVIVRYKIG